MNIDPRLKEFELEKAKWLSCPKVDEVLEFSYRFSLTSFQDVKIAISGLGFFEARINGKKIDPYFYEPAVSDYLARDTRKEPQIVDGPVKQVFFVIRNITALCHKGLNELTILLGNGYFQNEDRPYEPFLADYGAKRLAFSIKAITTSNEVLHFFSGPSSLVRKTHFISGLYKGNRIDFQKNENAYTAPLILPDFTDGYSISSAPLDVLDRAIEPLSSHETKDGVLYDFGINHSGGVHLLVKGQKGQKIVLRHAETLYPNGSPNYETSRYEEVAADGSGRLLQRIDQVSEYTLSGHLDEIRPLFNWFSYRYVEIVGLGTAKVQKIESWFIHAEITETGRFHCSVPLLNEMEEKGRLTILDNLHAGLLSDCPHREKRPYTGDGHLVMETFMYQFAGEGFYAKWLDDLIASQREDGFIPYTAPHLGGGGGLAWGLAIIKVPSLLYSFTGKKSYLVKAFEPILRWIGFLQKHQGKDCSIQGQNWLLGDWLTPGVCQFSVPLMNAICLHCSLFEAVKMAHALKRSQEEAALTKKLHDCVSFINASFYDSKKKRYASGEQGEDLYPLLMDIVPSIDKKEVLARLAKHYRSNGYHVDTGIVMTPMLFEVLFNNGLEDLAYRILTATTYPSFADMLAGETTFVEHWSKKWMDYKIGDRLIKGGGELSHCHPVFSAVNACLYKYVAGLDLSNLNERLIVIDPRLLKEVDAAEASKALPEGLASCSYSHERNGRLNIKIEIPPKYKGKLILQSAAQRLTYGLEGRSVPNKNGRFVVSLPSGSYSFRESDD